MAALLLALLLLLVLHGLGGGPSTGTLGAGTRGANAAGAGTPTGLIRRANVAALEASAKVLLDEATARALPTGLGPGAVDPSSGGATFLEAAAGDVAGKAAGGTLQRAGDGHYELSSHGAVVCITAPASATGAGSVSSGPC